MTPPHQGRLGDGGLQLERTALSWQRTLLATAGAALAVVRLSVDASSLPALVLGSISLVLSAVVVGQLRLRDVRLNRHPTGAVDMTDLHRGGTAPALAATLATAFLGVAGVWLLA